ncbi:MAG: hypothetical protein V4584_04755 [Verrucomicrobiota bacterium]
MTPSTSSLLVSGVFAALSGISHATTIAFWDFNDHPTLPSQVVQVIHNASTGAGILYQQKAEIELDGKTGVDYANAGEGLNAIAGKGMGWDDVAKSGSTDDGEFFITFSTFNFNSIVVSFDIKGNLDAGEGIQSFDLKYALTALDNNAAFTGTSTGASGSIKVFAGGLNTSVYNNQAVSTSDVYTRVSFDLSSITALNNQNYVALRFDDWKEGNALSIDNLLITGIAVPEPTTALLGGITLLGLLRRRR